MISGITFMISKTIKQNPKQHFYMCIYWKFSFNSSKSCDSNQSLL